MSRGETLTLYLGIMIISVVAAMLSQHKKIKNNAIFYQFSFLGFAVSFFALWIVSSFTNIGVDYDSYTRIIREAGFNSSWTGEFGFNYMCMFFKLFCGENYDLVIFLTKTITLLIFYRSFYLLRRHMRIGLAVFAFVLMSYLRFYLISMHLAAALILLSVTYLYLGLTKKGIVFYLLAISIHYSSIFLFPAYFLFLIITSLKKKFSGVQILFLATGYFGVFFGIFPIYNFMVSHFSVFSHYKEHSFITNYSGLGIMQIIYYIPIFYMAIMIYRCSNNKRLTNLTIVMSFTGFFYAMLGYRMEVMSRMYEHFLCLYMLCVPVLFYERKTDIELSVRNFAMNYRSDMILWSIYILVRGIDVMNDILQITSSSQMSNWRFFLPF